jgi:hypothetical protein
MPLTALPSARSETDRGLDVGSAVARALDPLRGGVEVVRPPGDRRAGERVDPVVQAEVERAGQGDAAGVTEGVEDAELVVLVSPLDLLVEPHRDLRLVRGGGDRVEAAGGGRLDGALLDELRLREVVERDVVHLAEPLRLAAESAAMTSRCGTR